MNDHIGVHGCGLTSALRPTIIGTVSAWVVGSTVLTAVSELAVWAALSVAVEVPASEWS